MKTAWVRDLQVRDSVESPFLIAECDIRVARDENSYLKMRLQDRTGAIDAIRWRATDEEQEMATTLTHIDIAGRVDLYKGALQITVDTMHHCMCDLDPADYLQCCPHDADEMHSELLSLAGSISHPPLRALVESAIGNTDTGRSFARAPAAVKVHHAYISGLLEHTLSVARMCSCICDRYPDLNRDLLMAGAIFHDIGKIDEYEWTSRICQSDRGALLGHIVQGVLIADRLMREIPALDEDWRLLLTHMIVSHHGQLEWGSPRVPMCREAIALHFIEDMDAKLNIADRELADSPGIGGNGNWTRRIPWLDCCLYRGVPGLTDSYLETSPAPGPKSSVRFESVAENPR